MQVDLPPLALVNANTLNKSSAVKSFMAEKKKKKETKISYWYLLDIF